MANATTDSPLDLTALPWPATMRQRGPDRFEIDAPDAPDDRTLQSEVDAASPPPAPGPTVEERLAAAEAKLDAVAQLAEQADATAQDVAQRVRDADKPS